MTLLTLITAYGCASASPLVGERAGALTGLLRPFAQRPHVFVTAGEAVTTVTIHKNATLDLELAIATGELSWTAIARDVVTGQALVRDTRSYRDSRPAAAARAAMLAELRAFLLTAC